MTIKADADVLIVGAGFVGLSIAAKCASLGDRILILERANGICSGISGRGSNVAHSGLYYPEFSLKKQFCIRGQRLLYEYCKRRKIRHDICGKLVVASDSEEIEGLELIASQAQRNGVEFIRMDGIAVQRLEPDLQVTAALFVPGTGVIDGRGYCGALVEEIQDERGTVLFNHKVTRITSLNAKFVLEAETPDGYGIFTAEKLVLAGGLGSHALAKLFVGYDLSKVPAPVYVKGSYFRYSGEKRPFRHLVYPTPVSGGLGIHLTLALSGEILLGPDVERLDTTDENKIDYAVSQSRAEHFYTAVRRYWPGLPSGTLEPDRSGVRPQLQGENSDFIIQTSKDHGHSGLVSLFGIESPGLTSSLAIADYVIENFSN